MSKKLGKPSCCAFGGAWFKNCGNPGDIKFDHTWTEGIEACSDFGKSLAVKKPEEFVTRKQKFVTLDGETNVVATANSQGYCDSTNMIVTISILFFMFHFQI